MHRVNRRRRDQEGQQLELPVALSGRGSRWAASAGRAARVAVAFVLRWALRFGLPLLGGAAALQLFPYHATVQGVPFTVQGSLFQRPGLSADTTLGSWEFPDVDGLPIGAHITPRDVDLLALTRAAGHDTATYVQHLRADFAALVPHIITWLAVTFVVGVVTGLAAAAAVNMSVRYLRGAPRRSELRLRGRQLAAAGAVALSVAGYGAASFNPHWVQRSRLTGTLAAAQLFPAQLRSYYTQQSKAFDVLGSVVGIQAALQAQIESGDQPPTALRIMYISDMHLAADYPLVAQYAANYDVDLIINTGDESEFGTAGELTPAYLSALRTVTARTPMLWLAGNHDSPAVLNVMSGIRGVTVVGAKAATADGYRVTAGVVEAYGLTIAGLPDPRVYGGPGAYGADDPKVTDPLERRAVDEAVGGAAVRAGATATGSSPAAADASAAPAPSDDAAGRSDDGTTPSGKTAAGPTVDIFATHEPVAAEQLRAVLPGRIRETVAGHVHLQNDPGDLQHGSRIDLVEGSAGAGGLDNIVRGAERPPIEFSIGSVGVDCQFTRIVRFQIDAPADGTASPAGTPQAFGDDVTAATVYFRPQQVAADRTCGTELGIGTVRRW
jgi:Calcineurin-like phosphoesterase